MSDEVLGGDSSQDSGDDSDVGDDSSGNDDFKSVQKIAGRRHKLERSRTGKESRETVATPLQSEDDIDSGLIPRLHLAH